MKIPLPLAALVAVFACGAGAGPPAPDRSVRVTIAKRPGTLALADLNGDARLDLVVAHDADDTGTVLLGDGKGGFVPAPGSPFPAGHAPNDVAIGDFDGDSRPDLAFANHEAHVLTVLLGDGRGGFRPAPGSPVSVRSRPHPHGVAAADSTGTPRGPRGRELGREPRRGPVRHGRRTLRGARPVLRRREDAVPEAPRGRPERGRVSDLVTTNFEGADVTVLLGDGKRGFAPAPGSPFPAGRSPFSVAIADVDRDGRLDLAVANYSGQGTDASRDAVNVLLGDGRGGFRPMKGSPFAAGRSPVSVAVGDVNGDGWPDVVTANTSSDDVAVLLGDGAGSLRPALRLPAGREAYRVAVGDVDGDGRAEIFVSNHVGGDVVMLRLPAVSASRLSP